MFAMMRNKKNLMIKHFPLRLKAITQRRLHSAWITTGIMKGIRKNLRWFGLLRNCWLSYRVDKIYVKNFAFC